MAKSTSIPFFIIFFFFLSVAFYFIIWIVASHFTKKYPCNCKPADNETQALASTQTESLPPTPTMLCTTTNLSAIHTNMKTGGWSLLAMYIGTAHDAALNARWTSQIGQDRTLFKLFNGKTNGYFVDLAANDAVYLSNTLTLEQEYGWRGLCIEANPGYMTMLAKRKCQVVQAVVGEIDNVDVDFYFNGGLGGIVGSEFDNKVGSSQVLKTVSVQNIFSYLEVPRIIDYMSLDIEGAEEWAFQTFPWNLYTFNVITAERPKQNLRETLKREGYTYICDHGDFGDELWIHSSFGTSSNIISALLAGSHDEYQQQINDTSTIVKKQCSEIILSNTTP